MLLFVLLFVFVVVVVVVVVAVRECMSLFSYHKKVSFCLFVPGNILLFSIEDAFFFFTLLFACLLIYLFVCFIVPCYWLLV